MISFLYRKFIFTSRQGRLAKFYNRTAVKFTGFGRKGAELSGREISRLDSLKKDIIKWDRSTLLIKFMNLNSCLRLDQWADWQLSQGAIFG